MLGERLRGNRIEERAVVVDEEKRARGMIDRDVRAAPAIPISGQVIERGERRDLRRERALIVRNFRARDPARPARSPRGRFERDELELNDNWVSENVAKYFRTEREKGNIQSPEGSKETTQDEIRGDQLGD